jgi:hypothetical protein
MNNLIPITVQELFNLCGSKDVFNNVQYFDSHCVEITSPYQWFKQEGLDKDQTYKLFVAPKTIYDLKHHPEDTDDTIRVTVESPQLSAYQKDGNVVKIFVNHSEEVAPRSFTVINSTVTCSLMAMRCRSFSQGGTRCFTMGLSCFPA